MNIKSNIQYGTTKSHEKIIADALEIGMNGPRVHNVLPFTILKNSHSLDFKKLESLTKDNGTYRYAGFLLDLLKIAGYEIAGFEAPKYRAKPKVLFESLYEKREINRFMSNHLIDIKVSTSHVYANIMNMESRLQAPADLVKLKKIKISVPEKHDPRATMAKVRSPAAF